MKLNGDFIRLQDELETMSATDALRFVLERFHPKVAFASSFGAEDVVVIDLLAQVRPDARIFTLDTGRLHEETYEVAEKIRRRYGFTIESFFPEREEVERLERDRGLFSFRDSIANRKECCGIRKVAPLRRALSALDVWITGLRREQAVTRGEMRRLESDETFGLLKLNPIVNWSEAEVWEHIRTNDLPYNALHDRGFPSIGCAPCTRPIAAGEDVRAGRWWWELPEQKECGLHAGTSEERKAG